MELMDYLASAKKSLFRFEALQEYDVGEFDNIEKWKQSGIFDEESMKDWWDFLEQRHREGVKTQRVRRIVHPLNDYTKWELEGHVRSIQHGDEISQIDDARFQELKIPLQDFWLIDDRLVLIMNYSKEGKYLGCTPRENAAAYVRYKDLLLAASTPIHPEDKAHGR